MRSLLDNGLDQFVVMVGRYGRRRKPPKPYQVLMELLTTRSLAEIADQLEISYETARKHLRTLFENAEAFAEVPRSQRTLALWWLCFLLTGTPRRALQAERLQLLRGVREKSTELSEEEIKMVQSIIKALETGGALKTILSAILTLRTS